MNFPVMVKSCREFKYTNKKGVDVTAYNVEVFTESYDTFAIYSSVPFDVGDKAIMLISSGKYNKPFISVERIIV